MSNLLHFSAHTLQEVALGFMALVYITRIIWFLRRFKAGGEERFGQAFIYEQDRQTDNQSFINIRKCFFHGFMNPRVCGQV